MDTLRKRSVRLVPAVSEDSDSDVSESPDAYVTALVDKETFWTQRVKWYPDGCFGPYRAEHLGYSRRELAADALVHLAGIVVFAAGAGALLHCCLAYEPAARTTLSILFYATSLLVMLACSFVFNAAAWSRRHLWALQLGDHLGIHSLIVGTATAILEHAGMRRHLALVWALAVASLGIKAGRLKRLDVLGVHIPVFLAQGLAVVCACAASEREFSAWAKGRVVAGGLMYAAGLVPWATSRWEFHNAAWHAFVLAGSACLYSVIFHELIPRPAALAAWHGVPPTNDLGWLPPFTPLA